MARVATPGSISIQPNPLYSCRFFHCYMLDKFIPHFRDVRSILLLLFYFLWKILLANTVDPDQMPPYVASDLGLQCLPMTFYDFQVRMG